MTIESGKNAPTARATLADVKPGGMVRLGDQAERARFEAWLATQHDQGSEHVMATVSATDDRYQSPVTSSMWSAWQAANSAREGGRINGWKVVDGVRVYSAYAHASILDDQQYVRYEDYLAALSAQPSPGDQDALDLDSVLSLADVHAEESREDGVRLLDRGGLLAFAQDVAAALAARQPVGEPVCADCGTQVLFECTGCSRSNYPTLMQGAIGEIVYSGEGGLQIEFYDGKPLAPMKLYAAPPAQAVDLGPTFQDGVADWMGQCFLPSLYSNMTERGDRLLEEVLELLQAHGYDKARVPTLVDYVFGRPVGEPVQEVGGVMVTLAGYCWVAGIDMHAAGDAELARINQPDVMAKIRAKQEAKNALHFDTPLPGDPAATEAWPREGDLVRYGDGASALAIRLEPHAGGWHGYQCCGGYTFFTKAYRPSRADMDTWLDCAKYRDERTKVADNRVAHEMYLLDSQEVGK